jgi:hypothetical protein
VGGGPVVSSPGLFALPGMCALMIFVLARPQEFLEILQRLPLLNLFSAAAVAGFVIDLRLRKLEPVPAPTFKWAVAFFAWIILSNVIHAQETLVQRTIETSVIAILFLTIGHAVQRLRALHVVAGALVATCLFLAFVCTHQGLQDRSCVAVDPEHPGEGIPDGRACEMADACYSQDAEPGAEYRCEKVGLFGTYSIEDRVRYRGELHDPNELSMTICIAGLSLLIAFVRRKRSPGWTTFGLLAGGLIFWCVTMSGSRGGLLVFMIVLGAWFIERYRWPGMVIGAIAAVPLALIALGGRTGEAADMSTQLRYEAWAAGLEMFKSSPVVGVGHRLFGENHYMTAHNSYVLTLAELGFPGFVMFVSLLVLSIKMLARGVIELEHIPEAQAARDWGLALLASFAAMCFQISTLSFAYHSVLWIMLGLAAGWWSAVRVHKPDFQVELTGRDLVLVVGGCVGFVLFVLPLFLRLKGA